MNPTIRFFFIAVFAMVALPSKANIHPAQLPAFESFSFYKEMLFSRVAVIPAQAEFDLSQGDLSNLQRAKQKIANEVTAEPSTPQVKANTVSSDEYVQLQFAIDKASSRAMTLGLDYQTLLRKIQRLENAQKAGGLPWFSSNESDFEQQAALATQNGRILEERQKEIGVLKTKLAAGQARYADENVKRLLADKKVALLKDKSKKATQLSNSYNTKLRILNDQIQQNKDIIDQLGIALTREKMKSFEQVDPTDNTSPDPAEAENEDGVLAPEIVAPPSLNTQSAVSEWTIQGLAFEEASAEIKNTALKSMDDLLGFLQNNGRYHIQINGYTDSLGSAATNQNLSQARADAVATYLIGKGLEPFRISALGFGERRPIASNQSELGRIKNRRVTVSILQ